MGLKKFNIHNLKFLKTSSHVVNYLNALDFCSPFLLYWGFEPFLTGNTSLFSQFLLVLPKWTSKRLFQSSFFFFYSFIIICSTSSVIYLALSVGIGKTNSENVGLRLGRQAVSWSQLGAFFFILFNMIVNKRQGKPISQRWTIFSLFVESEKDSVSPSSHLNTVSFPLGFYYLLSVGWNTFWVYQLFCLAETKWLAIIKIIGGFLFSFLVSRFSLPFLTSGITESTEEKID